MQPDPSILMQRIDLDIPLLGFYDAPNPKPFEPFIRTGKGNCVFDYFQQILAGDTLLLTKDQYGCSGAGRSICGAQSMPDDGLVKFLVEKEGLKVSEKLMLDWVKSRKMFSPKYGNILIGWLKPDQYEYLKSVTFVVNPDQLSALMTGAQYFAGPDDPTPVIAPFGSGCSLFVLFDDLDKPQSLLGASDMAMREHVKPDQILFTVTKPMFEQLCRLGEKSFLFKQFWGGLRKSRGLPDM
ncbi:MAG: DUF169 domain-containing protein [bacterium]|nr:DUF169 domain-containing protein [bacterium]